MARFALILTAALVILVGARAAAQDTSGDDDVAAQFVGDPRFPAPDFPAGLEWLNVPAPVHIEQLRGKVVILDFWTYGCINCIHMIPVLEQLEEKYGEALAVIGVHSAKFANEGQTDNLRQIVARYGLAHPVINDNQFAVWQTFGVNAWPTFVVIDPRGNVFARQGGEIPFEAFDRVVGGMIGYFDGLGEIKREPLEVALEAAKQPGGLLSYPGKILVDAPGGHLFIADSSANRLVVADLTTYEVVEVIGTGEAGFSDGGYGEATFNTPQGLALDGDTLYVADTDNHALRAVNLVERTVTTLAGTGERGFGRTSAGIASETALASPWDVALGDDGVLYIANAGTHQIWALLLPENTLGPIVGSGREGLVDGALASAELAQPSGLYYDDGLLYFADSESSSIRVADIRNNEVHTLAGPVEFAPLSFSSADQGKGGVIRFDDLALPPGDYLLGVRTNGTFDLAVTPTSGDCAIEELGLYPEGTFYRVTSNNCAVEMELKDTSDDWTLTIERSGGLLFQFGDIDGVVGISRLQHALGVVGADDGMLYVADTYNSKIKRLDPETKEITNLFGLSGSGGFQDGGMDAAQFDEPGGLDYADGKLYVADTNNGAIRVIDLGSDTVSTVIFSNPEILQRGDQIAVIGGSRGLEITLPEQVLGRGAGEIALTITLPDGYKLNPNIPLLAEWSSSDAAISIAEADQIISLSAPEMPLRIPISLTTGSAVVSGDLTIYYCEAVKESLCFIDQARVNVPVVVADTGASQIQVERDIIPPQVPTSGGIG